MRHLNDEYDTALYTHGLCRAFISVKSFCKNLAAIKNIRTDSLSCILIMKRKERIERNDIHAYVNFLKAQDKCIAGIKASRNTYPACFGF